MPLNQEPLSTFWRTALREIAYGAAQASVAAREAGDKDAETVHGVTALCAQKALETDRELRLQDN